VLGAAPLTVLLSETFERRLFADGGRAPTLDLPGTPALILNTTVTGHPDEESALLMVGLDRRTARREGPALQAHGRRAAHLHQRQAGLRVPQARRADRRRALPYVIVRDPAVRLARRRRSTRTSRRYSPTRGSR
jgi:hypothetical protein